jgi:hypothetical protein
LYLVDKDNRTKVTEGKDLVGRLKEWHDQPFVIVLASCESGGAAWDDEAQLDEFGTLAALGPRLAAEGVPAVLAMQGNVTMDTIKEFVPTFFQVLLARGSVDQAVTVARGRVRQRQDFWMPVLFSRVASGEPWYAPGLQPARPPCPGHIPPFQPWDGLIQNIRRGTCTPVLGFGLLESLIGPRADIAWHWAERYGYPLAEADRGDLFRMAQFVAVHQANPTVPGDRLMHYLRAELLDRLDEATRAALPDRGLATLLRATGARRRAAGEVDSYAILAALPFRTYLSATPDQLLEDALRAAVRRPQVHAFDWLAEDPGSAPQIQQVQTPEEEGDATAVGLPPRARPLVYRLFGSLENPDTLVLTEESHLDYLVAMTRALQKEDSPIPLAVRRALTQSGMLFLGFRITDWDFRVLLRSIHDLLSEQGVRDRRRRLMNVAVQIDPESDCVADVGLARRYLADFLGRAAANVSIYWGRVEDFLHELNERFTVDQEDT